MKLCVTVLSLLVLVAAFCSPALSAPMGSDPPTACCFSYTVRKLSRNFVVDYYETSSLCSQPAVVAAQEGSHAPELPTWTMIRQRKMVTTGKG
ncbi:PREDICTED: C-C motif chemokine 4 isoform X3 [Colobus angolensis palliatus]|uniref:C-C motif chemokine 4 isoform X3 n=1 Tax=Colobus angolensis palliatus TaxID=336983 RepID=UPI0005F4A389|nr:PREDICTED: C-C motif chemokine 4 isoform X3 [Colobus angolensis palliatus]